MGHIWNKKLAHPINLRPATPSDLPAIRALIHKARINPTGLNWRRFLIAVDEQDRLVGCGQVKAHSDGSRELASIAVAESWRGQGVARAIIERLLDTHPTPLYLTCRASLGPFYKHFGFRPTDPSAVPDYFRRLLRLARLARRLGFTEEELLVMDYADIPGG